MNGNDTIREQLSAYLDGELTADEAARVERAVAEDESLAEELQQLRATRDLLKGLARASAPEGFAERIAAQAGQRQRGATSPTAGPRWIRYAGAAAVLVAAIGLGVLVSQMWLTTGDVEGPHSLAVDDYGRSETIAMTDTSDARETPARAGRQPSGPADRPDVVAGEAGWDGRGAAVVAKGGDSGRPDDDAEGVVGRKGPDAYDWASNVADARDSALGKLRTLNGGNELSIFVDDVPTNQDTVETILVANGIALAPDDQAVVLPSQAVNLNRNFFFNEAQQRQPQPETEEVQYLVYGSQEQLADLAAALESKVVRQQRVSQLPEPLFRQAIEDPGLALAEADEVRRYKKEVSQGDYAGARQDAPASDLPHRAEAEIAKSKAPAPRAAQEAPPTTSARRPEIAPAGAPTAPQASPPNDGKQAEQPEALASSAEVEPTAEELNGKAAPANGARPSAGDTTPVQTRRRQAAAPPLPLREVAAAQESVLKEQARCAAQRIQAGLSAEALQQILAEAPAEAMVITLRRRPPTSRLNTLQQTNLRVLEEQLQPTQQAPNAAPDEARDVQTAPAQKAQQTGQ
ncbi:MAG: hypothetical protein GVY16_10460 [Planctomycetes bacterium]|jgi:hypothetical protein|nr:hypothetical protein [Planctomycetota bacterium]